MDNPRHMGGALGRITGLILVIAAPALAWGNWRANRELIDRLNWYLTHPADTGGYASAIYHARHAIASEHNRWQPSGYMMLGTIGFLLGVFLLYTSIRATAGTLFIPDTRRG